MVDILYVSDNLVIACLPCAMWQIFSSFFIFYSPKGSTNSLAKNRKPENIGHIGLGSV